eukprot:scaffold36072_cov40-Phaeocystis_antarctica.AAC.1
MRVRRTGIKFHSRSTVSALTAVWQAPERGSSVCRTTVVHGTSFWLRVALFLMPQRVHPSWYVSRRGPAAFHATVSPSANAAAHADTATPRLSVTVKAAVAPSSAFDLCGCIQRALLATRRQHGVQVQEQLCRRALHARADGLDAADHLLREGAVCTRVCDRVLRRCHRVRARIAPPGVVCASSSRPTLPAARWRDGDAL